MISFGLEEDQELIRDTVRKFAAEVVRPAARQWERAGEVPPSARAAFFELGLGLLDVPEALGGGGAGALTGALLHEELAFGDPGASVALFAPHHAAAAVLELGDEAQARRLLARFSEAGGASRLGAVAWSEKGAADKLPLEGFATVAERSAGGYTLRGEKAFVVNGGRADLTVVFAQVEAGKGWDGIGAFAVEGGAGITAGARHRQLGLETVHAAEVSLSCEVPEANRLVGGADFRASVLRFFDRVALVNAARQVGLARAAYEYALDYTQGRIAFGKPVAHFQSIAFTLAEMLMDVDSARWLVWRAAAALDRGALDGKQVAQAAVQANEAAWRVADNGVQLLGGAGYIQDFLAEKWLRDTKALALFGPSSERQQLLAAAALLGHSLESPLPSSAIQPIFT